MGDTQLDETSIILEGENLGAFGLLANWCCIPMRRV